MTALETTKESAPSVAALATATHDPKSSLRALLEKSKPSFAAVLPRHLTPDRLLKLAMAAVSKDTKLLTCTQTSILQAVMTSAELGLEPNTPLGLGYILPFRNAQTGQNEATFIVGFKGLVRLAYQSGEVESWYAETIYERDRYLVRLGSEPRLDHEPCMSGDRGGPVAFYSVVKFKGSAERAFLIMTKADIEKIRARSKQPNGPAWSGSYDEMAKKTVMRRHSKVLPLSEEKITHALQTQATAEAGEVVDFDLVEVLEAAPAPTPAPSATATLKDKLKAEEAATKQVGV